MCPNWCENELTVSGPDLKYFKIFAKYGSVEQPEIVAGELLEREGGKSLIDFRVFIPYPEEFAEPDRKTREYCKEHKGFVAPFKDGYNSGGYEWCIQNWGTKWGASETEIIKETSRSVRYTFQTAWSPPIPVVREMSRKFPSLRFRIRFWEGGMGFQGNWIFKAGKDIKHEEKDYKGGRGG